jgi:2,4-dienoyl-CoA reductase-like NADH-dependent reductase (Old Yellow Enzyme family)
VLGVVHEVRRAVGPSYPVAIRINSTDKLDGGLTDDDALEAVRLLGQTSVDLIDISGGTYFPGAKAASDSSSPEPYFLEFARRAKSITSVPVMATGRFKKREQAVEAMANGAVDRVGLARAMVLNPRLAEVWLDEEGGDPDFPIFVSAPPSGITDWYIMRLAALGEGREASFALDIPTAMEKFEERTVLHATRWREKFGRRSEPG